MTINFDPNKLNKTFDQMFGSGSYQSGMQKAQNAARLKTMASFAKQDYVKKLKSLQAKAKKDQEYLDKYGMTYDDYQAKKAADKKLKEADKEKLSDGSTSEQRQKQRDKAEAEGRGGYQPTAENSRKESKKNSKDEGKSPYTKNASNYNVDKLTPYAKQKLGLSPSWNNKKSSTTKKKTSSIKTSSKNEMNWYDKLNAGAQRIGDQFYRTVFGDKFADWNNDQYKELAKYQLKKNLNNTEAKKSIMRVNAATSKAKTTGQKALNYVGGTAGTIAPFLVGDGLLGVAEKGAAGLTKGVAQKVLTSAVNPSKLVSNQMGKLALQGAMSGLAGSAVNMGAHSVMSGEKYTPSQIALNTALNGVLGAAVPPALTGIAKNLNLKGQLSKVLDGTKSTKFNPADFEKALQDAYPAPKGMEGDPLNIFFNTGQATPKVETPKAITKTVKLKTIKSSKDINEMNPAELEDVWQQLHAREQALTEQGADKIHMDAIHEDINRVDELLLNFDLQFFGAPKPRVVEPIEPTVPIEHVQTPLELELQKLKDIKQFQVGTQHLYELSDRLPKEMGNRIKNALDSAKINHVNHLESSANDFYNKIVKELGIKKGSKESALVQDFGEKTLAKQFLEKLNIDPARLTPEQLDEVNLQQLQQIRRNDWQKIVEADKFFRENYDNLLEQVNNVRTEVYKNHPEKLVPKRQDYYHHFNELTGLEGLKNLFDSPGNIDPQLEGISPYTRPNSKWQAFMQHRGNGAYKSDAVGGYLNYLKASSHSIHLDPVIKVLRQSAKTVAEATEYTKNANKIVQALQMQANDLAGKTSEYDRLTQLVIGRKGMKIINNLNSRVKSNMILGNVGSVLGQLGNLPLGIAKAKFHSVPAAMDTLNLLGKWVVKGEKDAPIYQSQFLKERFIDKTFRKFDAKLLDKPKNMAVWLLETADRAQTSYLWNAMYRKGLSKGVADPIKFADYETRKIVAGRGVGEVPLLQKARLTQVLMPFTLEVGNQWKVLSNMVGEKDAAGVITFLVASAGINTVMEKTKGSAASYNPVGALIEGYSKKDGTIAQKLLGALASLNGETVGNLPGGNYIPQMMGLINDNQKESIFGVRSPDRFGTGVGVTSTLFKPATDAISGNWKQAGKDALTIALPYGGNQIKKTAGGIEALAKGGSYDTKGQLQYPVDSSNPADVLHSLLFGATTTEKGRDYYKKGRKSLSAKNTQQVQNSSNQKETYDMLRKQGDMKAIKRKINSIQKDRRLSPSAKQAMITRLMNQVSAK